MLELTSERLRIPFTTKPIEPTTGIYLVSTQDQVLYVGQNFDTSQKWLTDSEFHKLMGWSSIQIEALQCPMDQVEEVESALIKKMKPQISKSKEVVAHFESSKEVVTHFDIF